MDSQLHNGSTNGGPMRTENEGYKNGAREIPELLRELLRESQALVRGEAQLLKTELSEKISEAKMGVTSMIGGGIVVFAGVLVLLAAAVLGLGEVMPLWASALLVGGATAIVGAIMLSAGKKKLEPENLKPQRIVDEVKADKGFVKERAI